MRPVTFRIAQKRGRARAGVIATPHGAIETPCFVAVGTKATVKGLTPVLLKEVGLQVLIANTYHLFLQPGPDIVAAHGGVGTFMGFTGPTMTDSGGFQVFSLGEGFGKKLSKFAPSDASSEDAVALWREDVASEHGRLAIIDDEGVSFTSHLDGTLHRFTPERSIEIQHKLGADIIFAFDECTAPTAPHAYQKEAMERTHAWAKRSLAAHRQDTARNASQGIYGIVQGGRFEDLRRESAETLGRMDFDGYGVGGSFNKQDILKSLDLVNSILPEEKPRHLLGIGEPEDIFLGVAAGIDTFDCVLPTRNARNGTLYTCHGKINVGSGRYSSDLAPVDPSCACSTCAHFTRSYLHHLFRANEMLAGVLATVHNLHFLVSLVREVRTSLLGDYFERFREEFIRGYTSVAR